MDNQKVIKILLVVLLSHLLIICSVAISSSPLVVKEGTIKQRFRTVRGEGDIVMELITPDGINITSESAFDNPLINYTEEGLTSYYDVANPESGTWYMVVQISNSSSNTTSVTFTGTHSYTTSVGFAVWGGGSYTAGDSVHIEARISGNNLTNITIMATIEKPDNTDSIQLVEVADEDGDWYYGSYNDTDVEGTYLIKATAKGLQRGFIFTREDNTDVEVTKYPDFKVDSSDVVFSNPTPGVGDIITVDAVISNRGYLGGDVTARIYYDWELVENTTVFLDKDENTTISTQLKVKDLTDQQVFVMLNQFRPCNIRCEENVENNFVKKSLNVEDSVSLKIKHNLNWLYDYSLAIILIFISLFAIHKYKKRIKLKIKTRIRRIIGGFKKINKKDISAIIIFIFGPLLLLIFLWQLGIFGGGPGTMHGPNACGGYGGFGKVKPMEPSLQLLYDGTLSFSLMNGVGAPMKLTRLEVRYEGEHHYEDIDGTKCIIQQPVTGTEFGAGRVFQVIAYCPNINKDAEHASIYLAFEYDYTHPKFDNEKQTRTEYGNLCLLNEGDEFS